MPRHTSEKQTQRRGSRNRKAIQFLQREAILALPYKTDGFCEDLENIKYPTEQDAKLSVEQRGIDRSRYRLRIWQCPRCHEYHVTDVEIRFSLDGYMQRMTFDDLITLYPDVYFYGFDMFDILKLWHHKFPAIVEDKPNDALWELYANNIPVDYWKNWWLWAMIRRAQNGYGDEGRQLLMSKFAQQLAATRDPDLIIQPKDLNLPDMTESRDEYPVAKATPLHHWMGVAYLDYVKQIGREYARKAKARQVAAMVDYDALLAGLDTATV